MDGDGADGAGLSGRYTLVASEGFEPLGTVRISFDRGEFGFDASCNGHDGPYAVEGGVFVLHGLGSTEIGCAAELHEEDEWLAEFFTGRPRIETESGEVTFVGKSATLTFVDREAAEPDVALVGTGWSIDTVVEGDSASSGAGITSGLVFAADGTFSVSGPCNTLSGDYEAQEKALIFSNVVRTRAACESPWDAEVEAHLERVFADGRVRFDVDVTRLRIDRGDVGILAIAEN